MSRVVFAAWLGFAFALTGCNTTPPCSSDNTFVSNGLCQCKYGTEQRDGDTYCLSPDGGSTEDTPGKPHSDADAAASLDARTDGSRRDATVERDATTSPAEDADAGTPTSEPDASSMTQPDPSPRGDDASMPSPPSCTSNCPPTAAMLLAVGWNHSCVATPAGVVSCWGDNSDSYAGTTVIGKLGPNATGLTSATPVVVPGLSGVVELAAGRGHSCARSSSGEVRCWGENDAHQLGPNATGGSSAMPVSVPVTGATQLSLGGRHSCARLSSGQVACWGDAGYAELGGTSRTEGSDGSIVMVQGLSDVAQVAVGYAHSCARRNDGTVSCWGWNGSGQIGSASLSVDPNSTTLTPLKVDVVETVDLVAAPFATCALWSSQTPVCWGGVAGDNPAGTLIVNSSVATAIEGASDIAQLSLGRYFACARQLGGSVICWGQNEAGELGYDPSVHASSVPDYAPNVSGVTAIGSGEQHTCVILESGHVSCWGNNNVAQLGPNATSAFSGAPVGIPGF